MQEITATIDMDGKLCEIMLHVSDTEDIAGWFPGMQLIGPTTDVYAYADDVAAITEEMDDYAGDWTPDPRNSLFAHAEFEQLAANYIIEHAISLS